MALAGAALVVGCGGGGGAPLPVPDGGGGTEPRSALVVVAGMPGGPGMLDGRGRAARFQMSVGLNSGLAVDTGGNVYVADTGNGLIRRISTAGDVVTWATGFKNPADIALDSAGNLFVADYGNHRIVRVSSTGEVSTWAGAGTEGSTDGAANVAQFSFPAGVAVDRAGNVYVGDSGNQTIRKISPAGVVSTLAGQVGWNNRGYQDGAGAQARFFSPRQLALDGSGNLLVADYYNQAVRTVDAAGNVGTLVHVAYPSGLAVSNSSLYISTNQTVIKLTAGVSTLVAGKSDGTFVPKDGVAGEARIPAPAGLGLDGAGNLYVVDGDTVRKVGTDAVVSTLAGAAATVGTADGAAANASFNTPDSVAFDGMGNLYVTDYNNHTVRRIAAGVVSTFAGLPGRSSRSSTPPEGSLDFPSGLVSDSVGNLDVVESWGVNLRRISSSGAVGALRSSGAYMRSSFPDGMPLISRGSVARDSAGNYYITDQMFNGVRKIDAAGNASLLAGPDSFDSSLGRGTADGAGTAARFTEPNGIAVDVAGTIYVADSGNHTIRRITPAGVVSTWAGLAGTAGDADGSLATARFNYPMGLVFDGAGNLYVSDRDNGLVRKITPAGVVSTVAGQRGKRGVGAGPLPATLNRPAGIVAGSQGELYITDTAEHLVLKITPP